MDRSLKERVIGASVLVVLAVWLIPWVLDGPVPDAESGAVQAPSAERSAPLRTQTIRLDGQRVAPEPAGETDIPGTPVAQVAEDDSGDLVEVTAASPPDVPATPSMRATAEIELDAPSANASVVAANTPRPVVSEPSAPASGATAATTVTATSGSGWFVQVGSFEAEENARRLAGRLADAGFTARLYPHTSGGRQMYRVRVGPQPDREGADEIASSLLANNFHAQVVSSD